MKPSAVAQLDTCDYALRVDRGRAVVLRRRLDERGDDVLQPVSTIRGPAYGLAEHWLARTATGMDRLLPGTYPLNSDDGPRIALYALVAKGLRDVDRISDSLTCISGGDGNECAWWLGMIWAYCDDRPLRAVRVLVGAVA